MRDNKKIRKVLYVSKSNIALVVMQDEDKNILFANQVAIEEDNLQVKVSELLTNAANFLGFNIKDVEMIFDDSQITKYSFQDEEFVDCNCEEDIAKEIFKKAKIDNYFVNEINFIGIVYDDIDKVARVNCQICASDYITYKKYLNAVKACNVVVTNSTNLYKLLKTNKDEIELTLKINDREAIACEYYGNKLNDVKTIVINLEEIKQHLVDKFHISFEKIDDILAIANELAITNDLDATVVNNYDLKTKSYNNVKANEIISLYRDEVKTQINNYVDYRNFHNVRVVSDYAINQIDEFGFAFNNEIGLEGLSIDKIVCLSNIDMNKEEITQFSFENKIKTIDLLA